jgi:plastocyanin
MRHRIIGLLAFTFVLVLLTSACSKSSNTTQPTSSGGAGGGGGGGGGSSITIKDFAFQPNSLSGSAGQTLTIAISNGDSVEHSFTLDDGSVSKDIEAGGSESVSVTLPDSGTVGWHCKYHSTMTGTITVG